MKSMLCSKDNSLGSIRYNAVCQTPLTPARALFSYTPASGGFPSLASLWTMDLPCMRTICCYYIIFVAFSPLLSFSFIISCGTTNELLKHWISETFLRVTCLWQSWYFCALSVFYLDTSGPRPSAKLAALDLRCRLPGKWEFGMPTRQTQRRGICMCQTVTSREGAAERCG